MNSSAEDGVALQLKNYIFVVAKQITYRGFIISNKNLDRFFAEVPGLIKSGKLTYGASGGCGRVYVSAKL